MKKPSNKVIAVYLAWVLLHCVALLWPSTTPAINWGGKNFYPFYNDAIQFDIEVYDLTEFSFYAIAPILIYSIISFWNKPQE